MGISQSIIKVNFEDVQLAYKQQDSYLLINTLSELEQQCLIKNTILASNEESLINNYVKLNKSIKIILYGKHSNDESVHKKYTQLNKLGFGNVYIYSGGLFEWLLLQDIYGADEFPSTSKQNDLLKYKPYPLLRKVEQNLITHF
jgi:hypothetical protein